MKENIPSLPPELQQLEQELLAMVPVEPSDGLKERVRQSLTEIGQEEFPADLISRPVGTSRFGWVPLAAAAAVAVMAVVVFPAKSPRPDYFAGAEAVTPVSANPSSTITDNPFKRHSSSSQLQHVSYEGIRQENSSPMRQIRSRYIESSVYVNPADGSTVELQVPREEVWLVPVSVE